MVALEQAWNDDVAALDQPHMRGTGLPGDAVQHPLDPGTGGIDENTSLDDSFGAGGEVLQLRDPLAPLAPGFDATGPQQDFRPAHPCIHRVQHDKARILHPAIGVGETTREFRLERRPLDPVGSKIQTLGAGQAAFAADMIVKEQPQSGSSKPDEAACYAAARIASAR